MDCYGPMRKVLSRCERPGGRLACGMAERAGKSRPAAGRGRASGTRVEPRQRRSQPARQLDVCC